MKKVILFLIILIFLFICVYSYTSCVTHLRLDKSIELCETIIKSIQLGENKVDKNIEGYEKVDKVIKELKDRDELPINLTEYFSEIINIDGFFEEINKDKSDITEEELEKIYNQVFGNNTSFVEEETIFIDNSGNKCIQLKDLRRLDNGDGVVKYFNGEYIIDNKYIPLSYSELQNINSLDFVLCEYINEENSFVYINKNGDILSIIYNMKDNIIDSVNIEYNKKC